jgi:hypothetical protein
MKSTTLFLMLVLAAFASRQSQTAVNNIKGNMTTTTVNFLQSLSTGQKQKAHLHLMKRIFSMPLWDRRDTAFIF